MLIKRMFPASPPPPSPWISKSHLDGLFLPAYVPVPVWFIQRTENTIGWKNLYPVDFRCIAMYLFDDVIRPLNNWALYKNRYCEREVPRPGTQHDGFDESSILELFIRGPVVLPVRPGYWVVSKMAAIIVQATCVYSNSELKLMIWQMTDTKEKHVT